MENILLQDIKNAADAKGDHKTSAMMDDIIEDYSTKIWMLKQSLE